MRLVGAGLIAALAAGCGGGGGTAKTVPAVPAGQTPSHDMVSVTFTMKWNSERLRCSATAPRAATARSVSVNVNGGTTQCLNAPASTIVIDAPVGTDTFNFATFDELNCQGNVLSRATVTKQIVLGAANTVTAVLNGVVVSLAISLSNSAPNGGRPRDRPNVNVSARDADGNTIVGPGDYSTPIRLDSGTTPAAALSLSTTTLPNAATTATLTYNGGTLDRQRPARRTDRVRGRTCDRCHDAGGRVHPDADVLPVLDPGGRQQAAVDRGRQRRQHVVHGAAGQYRGEDYARRRRHRVPGHPDRGFGSAGDHRRVRRQPVVHRRKPAARSPA